MCSMVAALGESKAVRRKSKEKKKERTEWERAGSYMLIQ